MVEHKSFAGMDSFSYSQTANYSFKSDQQHYFSSNKEAEIYFYFRNKKLHFKRFGR